MKWNLWHNYKDAFKYDVTKKNQLWVEHILLYTFSYFLTMKLQLFLFSQDTRDLK